MDRRHFMTTLAASSTALLPGVTLAMAGPAPRFARGRIRLRGEAARLIWKLQDTLDRQAAFVSRNCGPLVVDETLPMFFATEIENNNELLCAVTATLVYITLKHGFWPNAKIFRPQDIYSRVGASHRSGALDLITLWPFRGEKNEQHGCWTMEPTFSRA